ncbi:MAG: hypothetical protein IJP16_06480 [Clostridia bacterium]|nr:hypothetical protein [Clostridia bacterium]
MEHHFIIITPEVTLLDKRMVRLKERLEKKHRTTLIPVTERNLDGFENPVFLLPFSISPQALSSFIAILPEKAVCFGGGLDEESSRLAVKKGVRHINLLSDENFCQENARLTAEAALGILISSTETSLYGMRCAIFGYGRIGSRLATMLLSHGASIKVFTSSKSELDALSTRGIPCAHLWQRQDIDSFKCIVNTVPLHHVIPRDTLSRLDSRTLILDLASGSNNVDWAGVKLLGLNGEHATSLPGRFSPMSAAAVIERTVMKYLE